MENVIAFTGGQGATNGGFIFMALKPLEERKAGVTQFWLDCDLRWRHSPWPRLFCNQARTCASAGDPATLCTSTQFRSDSSEELAQWGPILLREMKKLPGFQDVNSDQQNGGLDHYLTYDRDTAARLGITAQAWIPLCTAPSDNRKSRSSTPS